MARQKYIPLFDDQLEVISFLSDAQLGSAVRAAMGFVRYGTEPALDGITGMFYQVLRAQYLRQLGAQQDGAIVYSLGFIVCIRLVYQRYTTGITPAANAY